MDLPAAISTIDPPLKEPTEVHEGGRFGAWPITRDCDWCGEFAES